MGVSTFGASDTLPNITLV